jgi:hypothetical protein
MSSGQLPRLRAKWVGSEDEEFCSALKGLAPIQMEKVALPFYLLIAAFLVGLLILFAEFLIKKWLWSHLGPLELLRQIMATSAWNR